MKKVNLCLLFSGILAVFIISGCRSPILQLYSGPKLPDSQVALIVIYGWNDSVIIDEKDLTPDITGKIILPRLAILPGKHEITWTTDPSGMYEYVMYEPLNKLVHVGLVGTGMLDAKAGKKYCFSYSRIRGDITPQSITARMNEVIIPPFGGDRTYFKTKDFTPNKNGTKLFFKSKGKTIFIPKNN